MRFLPALVLLMILAGCGEKEQTISKAEAQRFAAHVEARMAVRDSRILDSIFHPRELGIRIVKASGRKPEKGLIQGILQGLANRKLGKEILSGMGSGSSYEFIRQYDSAGHQHAVFRLFSEDGINYHDFELVKYHDRIYAADVYMLITGENLSTTLAHTVNTLMDASKGQSDKQTERFGLALGTIAELKKQGHYKEAKEKLDRLPQEVRQDRMFQIMNIQICSELSVDAWKEAIRSFEKLYGNEPSAQMTLLDGYLLNEEYGKALHAIDMIDGYAGGDPVLDYYRAAIYRAQSDIPAAVKTLEGLIKKKPDLQIAFVDLITLELQQGHTKNANAFAARYKANKSLDQSKLTELKEYYPELIL